MVKAIDVRKPWTFVLADDREAPEEERTVWHLTPLTASERAEYFDGVSIVTDEREPNKVEMKGQASAFQRILSKKLVGVDNFMGADGPVPFKKGPRGGAADEFLARLSPGWIMELGAEIVSKSLASSEDKEK